MRQQSTIAEKISCKGIGLHSGLPVEVTLEPARVNEGVVFVRKLALDGRVEAVTIPARPGAVSSTSHATTLAQNGVRVSTVEHLMATLRSLQVDNVRVELDGPELPVMDGSSLGWLELLKASGRFLQRGSGSFLRVLRPISIERGECRISIEPEAAFHVVYAVEFEHPAIGRQEIELPNLDTVVFEREIAAARTFGFLNEVDDLLRAGLARGGSLQNTIVLDEDRVLNAEGLRWPDEFVRHKVLDLLGDLALLGLPVEGCVRVERGGHSLHHALIRALLAQPDAWATVGCVAAGGIRGSQSIQSS